MSRRLRPAKTWLAAVAGCLLAVGCVLPDDFSKMEKSIADLRQELRDVKEAQAASNQRLDELAGSAGDDDDTVRRAEFADVKAQLGQIENKVNVVEEGILDANRRIDRVTADVERANNRVTSTPLSLSQPRPSTIEPGAEAPAPVETGSLAGGSGVEPGDPIELYNTAYTDFSRGKYTPAISGFETFVRSFPDSQLADNALYWVGECHYSNGDFRLGNRGL